MPNQQSPAKESKRPPSGEQHLRKLVSEDEDPSDVPAFLNLEQEEERQFLWDEEMSGQKGNIVDPFRGEIFAGKVFV